MEAKTITILGQEFKYEVFADCNEIDTWYWTEFYKETIKTTRKKYYFFGPIITKEEPKKIFEIGFNIEEPFMTKDELRNKLERKVELLTRKEQIARGELI